MDSLAEDTPEMRTERSLMIAQQIEGRGVTEPMVLRAMFAVPRHVFVPRALRAESYNDGPLAIGHGQTISQPYIVAYMTEQAGLKPGDRVLEIGTGCGYQTAVAAEIAREVCTIEIVETLAQRARATLEALGYKNIKYRVGDGSLGWPEEAPFDVILAAAAPERIPRPLLDQLAEGGRLVIPVGAAATRGGQSLLRVTRNGADFRRDFLIPVAFVPMTGRAQDEDG